MESQEPQRFKPESTEPESAQQSAAGQLSEEQLQELFVEIFKQPAADVRLPQKPQTSRQRLAPEDAFLDKLRRLINTDRESMRRSPSIKAQPGNIYRFSLPNTASSKERQDFWQAIAVLQQANPGWHVSHDFPRAYEAEAAVVFRQNQDALHQRIAYWLTSSLAGLIEEPYDR
jgi:hypothetical protein